MSGLQCHKRLWYEENHPERAADISISQQRIFDQSKKIGILAHRHFPEGVHINAEIPDIALRQTESIINRGESCLFEAAFRFNSVFARCHILQKDEKGWRIIEVKASTSVKEEHLHDLAVQKYVLIKQGLPISGTQLMHINRECVYPDLSNLFTIEDVTDQVDSLMNNVPDYIETFKTILGRDVEPDVLIGEQCDKPNPCPFKAYCWKDVPEKSIFAIPGLRWQKKKELIEKGIFSLKCLPDDLSLSQKQRTYVNSVLADQPEIDNMAIRQLLSDLEYPIHFFDFETDNPAVPRFQGLSPYQHFPFQYSCHVLQPDGVVTHHKYLHTDMSDPRFPLVESLLRDFSYGGMDRITTTQKDTRPCISQRRAINTTLARKITVLRSFLAVFLRSEQTMTHNPFLTSGLQEQAAHANQAWMC